MKKNKKLLVIFILIIITVLGVIIYNNSHYSKNKILAITNKKDEDFKNIYIKLETDIKDSNEKYINEIYAKDNVMYDYVYINNLETNEIDEIVTDVWDLEANEKTSLNHMNKTMSVSTIEEKRINRSCYFNS